MTDENIMMDVFRRRWIHENNVLEVLRTLLIAENTVLEVLRTHWIDENSVLELLRRRWIDENSILGSRGRSPGGAGITKIVLLASPPRVTRASGVASGRYPRPHLDQIF